MQQQQNSQVQSPVVIRVGEQFAYQPVTVEGNPLPVGVRPDLARADVDGAVKQAVQDGQSVRAFRG